MSNALIETLPGDVLKLIARELRTQDIIQLRASSPVLRANNHLRVAYQKRLVSRAVYYSNHHKKLELRDGQLYYGRWFIDNPEYSKNGYSYLERVHFFHDKNILNIWGTSCDAFVWCKEGLYQVTDEDRDDNLRLHDMKDVHRMQFHKLDQFDGMTPLNFVMARSRYDLDKFSRNFFHFKEGLYVSGLNDEGQLGLRITDQTYNVDEPVRLEFFNEKNILRVLSSGRSTYVHCTDGLYSFGSGAAGQLGRDYDRQDIPTRIDFFNDKKIKQIEVENRGVFVLCEEGLFMFGTPNNIATDPIHHRLLLPTYAVLNETTTVLRLEAPKEMGENPLAHCTDGVYELQPQRGGWDGMPRSLHWYRVNPSEAKIKSTQTLLQQGSSRLITRYLERHGKFHGQRAIELNSKLLHCEGMLENLRELIDEQLALYEPNTKRRRSARYDPKYFSTALHHKTKGPKWGFYHTLKKCQALLDSATPKLQDADTVHL